MQRRRMAREDQFRGQGVGARITGYPDRGVYSPGKPEGAKRRSPYRQPFFAIGTSRVGVD